MENKFEYDFNLCKRCMSRLEEVSSMLDSKIVAPSADDMTLLAGTVECDASKVMLNKYDDFINHIRGIKEDINYCVEELDILSRRMLNTEEEAERIAAQRGL